MRSVISTIFFLLFPLMPLYAATEGSTNLADLAELMAEETKISDKDQGKISSIIGDQQRAYSILDDKFNQLSSDEKYTVIKMAKKIMRKNLGYQIDSNNLLMEATVDMASDILKKSGKFIGDLSDEEIKDYFNKAKDILYPRDKKFDDKSITRMQMSSGNTCPLMTFPSWIQQRDPTLSGTHYYLVYPYYYSFVINEPNEYLCDYQLWYYTSKNYVWGRSWLANRLLSDFGGGVSKRVDWGTDALILGRIRTIIWLGDSGETLRQLIVI